MEINERNLKWNLKFLDSMLKVCLKNNEKYEIDPIDLGEKLFGHKASDEAEKIFLWPKKNNNNDYIMTKPMDINEETIFINAIKYLISLEYITLTSSRKLFLTFKGILFISNGGFYKEHIRQKKRDIILMIYFVVSIVMTISTFILSILLSRLII